MVVQGVVLPLGVEKVGAERGEKGNKLSEMVHVKCDRCVCSKAPPIHMCRFQKGMKWRRRELATLEGVMYESF